MSLDNSCRGEGEMVAKFSLLLIMFVYERVLVLMLIWR